MSSPDVATIIGFILFSISELLSLFPINTNGIFHTFVLGFQNSFKNLDNDIEVAKQLLTKKPNIANIINTVATNPVIKECVQNIIDNQHLIPQIQLICKNQEFQTLSNGIKNINPKLINQILNNNYTNNIGSSNNNIGSNNTGSNNGGSNENESTTIDIPMLSLN